MNAGQVLAIAGSSGSGKSTLAGLLAAYLGLEKTQVLHGDSVLIPKANRLGQAFLQKWDFSTLDAGLQALHAGKCFQFLGFDQQTRERDQVVVWRPAPVLIVEGCIALFSSSVLRFASLRVYVDAPPDLRVARQIQRLTSDGWYRSAARAKVVHDIKAKSDLEEPIIALQRANCDVLVDTSAPVAGEALAAIAGPLLASAPLAA